MSSILQVHQAHFSNLQNNFSKHSYYGIRYAFGDGFRDKKDFVEIIRELHLARKSNPDDAKTMIEDVAVACGFGCTVGHYNRESFTIEKRDESFCLPEIAGIQRRALFVKVLHSFFIDRDKWLSFRQYAFDYKVVEDEPILGDIYDDLRELESRNMLDLTRFRDNLSYMNENKKLDIIDAYMKKTGQEFLNYNSV